MKKIFTLLFLFPCALLAAEGELDIIERVINFVIFFALIYYFAADKIKGIFVERREGIANSLAKIQEKLQESKKEKQKAMQMLEEAKKNAKEIVATAHKESEIIAKKIEENTKVELENLIRQYNETINFERRKVEKVVIEEVLSEFLNKDSVTLSKDMLSQALLRKAA